MTSCRARVAVCLVWQCRRMHGRGPLHSPLTASDALSKQRAARRARVAAQRLSVTLVPAWFFVPGTRSYPLYQAWLSRAGIGLACLGALLAVLTLRQGCMYSCALVTRVIEQAVLWLDLLRNGARGFPPTSTTHFMAFWEGRHAAGITPCIGPGFAPSTLPCGAFSKLKCQSKEKLEVWQEQCRGLCGVCQAPNP